MPQVLFQKMWKKYKHTMRKNIVLFHQKLESIQNIYTKWKTEVIQNQKVQNLVLCCYQKYNLTIKTQSIKIW